MCMQSSVHQRNVKTVDVMQSNWCIYNSVSTVHVSTCYASWCITCTSIAIYTAGKWQLHGEKEQQPGAQTRDLLSNAPSAM